MSGSSTLAHPSRRRFLQQSATLLAASALPWSLASQAASNPIVGLQLYTLRDMMEQDVARTLEIVSAVGYREVEFAGYFGKSASDIKALLKKFSLKAPSVHVPLADLQQKLDHVIADALTIGHQYIVVPWLDVAQRGTTKAAWQAFAKELNTIGEQVYRAGLQLAYHNHDFEFMPVEGTVPYDILLNETDSTFVKMELDLFWTVTAGFDPVALFHAHPGRFPLWHVKDRTASGEMTDVGRGVINFKDIFLAADTAGVQHRFVEHDNSSNRMETIRQGFDAVSALLQSRT